MNDWFARLKTRINRKWWQSIGALLLLLAVLGQGSVLWQGYAGPLLDRVRSYWNQPAIFRSMIHQHWVEEEHRQLIMAVREEVPEGTPVMVPIQGAEFVLRDHKLMQFFLFPRITINCPIEADPVECFREAKIAQAAIIQLNNNPIQQELAGYMVFPINAEFSLLLPDTGERADGG